MTFRETLDKHLRAIRERDLQALAETLPDNELILIMSDGKLVRSTREFLDAHRGWFAMPAWTLDARPIEVYEAADLGVAVLHLDYREDPPGKPPVRQESVLTLIFRRDGARWVMVQDQNTPVRTPAAGG